MKMLIYFVAFAGAAYMLWQFAVEHGFVGQGANIASQLEQKKSENYAK